MMAYDRTDNGESLNAAEMRADLGNEFWLRKICTQENLDVKTDALTGPYCHECRWFTSGCRDNAPLYLDKVVDALTSGNPNVSVESVILPDGEQYKDMDILMKVFDKAIEPRLDRRCTFVALGCGVDSSVGGETGINHPPGKNLIGAFYQPQCVLIDTDTLDILPERELASGFVEVIKYELIRDTNFFQWQEKKMQALMARATLNLGHTFGHEIETSVGYGHWLHGEAVATGTVGLRSDILKQAKLPIVPPEMMSMDMFKSIMVAVADGLLRCILLKGPLGNCVLTGDYDRKALTRMESYSVGFEPTTSGFGDPRSTELN
ncbi:hypothetical protein TSUD_112080 [Trifolium subterraneum]|uniref:3-dehydroquinate synthase domain-containing protein n=1 Tax=Trifolium subterraneum TaxID=3900 RepID=A0A2Z6M2R8_TRISU|nr:hypothetical protein TSUD_112080 [Trifolium subterraneum]